MYLYEAVLPSADDRHKVNESVNYQLKIHTLSENQYDLCLDEVSTEIVSKNYNLNVKNKSMLY
jgi:hypothetical protein